MAVEAAAKGDLTPDPLPISYLDVTLYADLKAMRTSDAEAAQRLMVEIKGLDGPSPVHAFNAAMGQYLAYRAYLEVSGEPFTLLMAVSSSTYEKVVPRPAVTFLCDYYAVSIVVIAVETEEVEL